MSEPRVRLHQLVDELSDQQLARALAAVDSIRQDAIGAVLREIPGLQMPDHWPPSYPDVEPMPVAGEPPSEQLIRDRR
jgi:hypothetical protein